MTLPETLDSNISDMAQAIGLLVRRVRTAGGGLDQLSLTQTAVVGRLDREGPATTADLARAEGMKPQSMGSTIAALEKMGLVERTPHPTDGRQSLIVLTDEGAAARKSTRRAKLAWLAHAVGQLEPSERQILFAAGEIIRRLAES